MDNKLPSQMSLSRSGVGMQSQQNFHKPTNLLQAQSRNQPIKATQDIFKTVQGANATDGFRANTANTTDGKLKRGPNSY